MVKILEQEYISEVGKRANNEDHCGYISKSTYVVCDGVGGLDKGEIASDIVCRSILKSFSEDNTSTIELALPLAEASMAAYLEENQQSVGMATTLTLAHVRADGVYVAWVGDSRVYQFRSGKIHYVTRDHSWVNEALAMGLITQEEALNHPKSNIITRAVQGTSKPVKADSKLIQDILPNDYFLLCSDGVLESWTDEELEELFSKEESCAQILNQLKLKCEKLSKDNFTALAFKIEDAQIQSPQEEEHNYVEAIPISDFQESIAFRVEKPKKGAVEGRFLKMAVFMLAFLVLALTTFFFWGDLKKSFFEKPGSKKEVKKSSSKKEGQDEGGPSTSPEKPEKTKESAEANSDTKKVEE